MAFVLVDKQHNSIYILLVLLYSMVSLNFYFTYQLNKQCNRKVECSPQNSPRNFKLEPQIELKPSLKNKDQIESDKKDFNSKSSENHIHRNKRHLDERPFGSVDDINANNDSLNQIVYEYNSGHRSSADQSFHSENSHHSHRLRHRKRIKSRSASNQAFDDNSGPVVEFFPKPQPTQETPGYVWLTSYSRIPVQALEQYCLATQKYCPPAERGPPGPHGLKGNKGDRGPVGDKGSEGSKGPLGPRGPPGNKGESGLDGREGLPGEPGLDGAPGRDGKNGQDGMPGLPGIPGRSGINGTNGIPGMKGERGAQGVSGMTGLPGPRGKRGPPGLNGSNGIPGIQAWKHHNSTLLIPPVIGDMPDMQQTIIVKENENVRLKCTASGSPKPDITWRRDDKKAIVLGSVSHTMIDGNRVNITRISRDHSGIYVCVATNGVPPSSYKKFHVEVTFPPLVKIAAPKQMVGTTNGSFALLECFVEAFPPPLSYWQFGDKIIEDNWKYKIFSEESGPFGIKFVLNITYIEQNDYGMYKCITKNERGKTQGVFTLFEIDPRLPKKPLEEPSYVVYGEVPLPPVEAPECAPCPECNQIVQRQCKGSGRPQIASVSLASSYNSSSWKPLSKRTNHCLLSQIGKPVFYRDSDSDWGCWMRDPMPLKSGDEHKYWMITKDNKKLLNEFHNKESFRNKEISKNYSLLHRSSGNSQAVYSGSFYYSEEGTNRLVIFNLQTNETSYLNVADTTRNLNNKLLYTTQYNYMDISTDENGLWVIFPSNYTNNTMVLKFNATQTEYIWNLTIDHQTVGEMFIICGVLYGVDSVTERNTKIEFAFDLYRNQQIDVSIDFTNPFSQTNFISYNPRYQKLYTWDKGNQLEYPVRFNESIDINNIDNDSEYAD